MYIFEQHEAEPTLKYNVQCL